MSPSEIKETIVNGLREIKPGTELKYISGRNKVVFGGVSPDGGSFSVDRSGEQVNIGVNRIDSICNALAANLPVHVDTVLGAGGSERTVIETCLAHTSNVTWKSIGGRKHLQWSGSPAHLNG